MNLQNIYEKEGLKYADFSVAVNGLGIEYDEATHKVLDLHFSIMIQVDNILKPYNYISDENQAYYYTADKGILTIPIKQI